MELPIGCVISNAPFPHFGIDVSIFIIVFRAEPIHHITGIIPETAELDCVTLADLIIFEDDFDRGVYILILLFGLTETDVCAFGDYGMIIPPAIVILLIDADIERGETRQFSKRTIGWHRLGADHSLDMPIYQQVDVGVGVVVAVVAIVIEVAVVEAHTPATTYRTGTHILVNKYVGHVLAKRRIVGVGFGLHR